jgi:hypothetical protein
VAVFSVIAVISADTTYQRDVFELQKVALKSDGSDPQIASFSVHPDGHRIAFQTRVATNPAEIWLLQNFLPH